MRVLMALVWGSVGSEYWEVDGIGLVIAVEEEGLEEDILRRRWEVEGVFD